MRRLTSRSCDRCATRRLRAWLGALLLVLPAMFLTPTVALGDRWMPPDEGLVPRFFIEDVAVEGIRNASAEVVVSESLLEAGRPYTERELRDAVFRVNRLPFILEAAFALRKGSERGRYQLLITVQEVRNFFFGVDLMYNAFSGFLASASQLSGDVFSESLTAGIRHFAGQGVLFAAAGGNEEFQVGYSRYKIQDRPVFLRLAYAQEGCCGVRLIEPGLDPALATWRATGDSDRLELTLGVPLGGNHSLRFDATQLETRSAERRPLNDSSGSSVGINAVEQREIELAWVYDTTDDPVFPNRGDAMTAAVGLRQLEGDLTTTNSMDPIDRGLAATPLAEFRSRLVGLSLFGERHWPLTARQTVSLSLELQLSRSDVEGLPVQTATDGIRLVNESVDALEANFGVRYSVSLRGPRKAGRAGDLRWETLAGLLYLETSPVLAVLDRPIWGVTASTSLALRNSWGVFRFGFSFLDYDGNL